MILAQTIIAFPLVAGFTMAAVTGVDPALRLQVRALGATRWQTAWAMLDEARVGVIAAVVAGFGGIISEVGAVMLVGGNIAGRTRVLTTAIVLETNKGNFELAMALGLILLSIAFLTNFVILRLQGQALEHERSALQPARRGRVYGSRAIVAVDESGYCPGRDPGPGWPQRRRQEHAAAPAQLPGAAHAGAFALRTWIFGRARPCPWPCAAA